MSHPFLSHSFFLLFTLLVQQNYVATAQRCHEDDENGLLGFKSGITADPSGLLQKWKLGTYCCEWDGIGCAGPDGRVNTLFIRGNASNGNGILSGTISSSLSKLRYLDFFLLRDLGNLTGPFPELLYSLPNVYAVEISNCSLSGPIPESIGNLTKLTSLELEGNQFSRRIPSSLAKLTLLTVLNLSGNRLSGTLPSNIRRLRRLFELNLSGNQLSGAIPDIFSALANLQIIRLSNKKFTGKFPESISRLNPIDIDLAHNYLMGEIPDFVGNFSILKRLNLSWNQFSGVVPQSFVNLRPESLDLSHNNLNDPFPGLPYVQILDLSYNHSHFRYIPIWVTESDALTSLKLAKCGINATLGDWKPHLPFLYEYIDLSDNSITGSPLPLLNIATSLVSFKVSNNKLKFNMKNMKIRKTKLKYLDLSNNLVFGNVPKAISGLEELNVSSNHLCGQLPATKFPAGAFLGNDCLCGTPLPSISTLNFQPQSSQAVLLSAMIFLLWCSVNTLQSLNQAIAMLSFLVLYLKLISPFHLNFSLFL